MVIVKKQLIKDSAVLAVVDQTRKSIYEGE